MTALLIMQTRRSPRMVEFGYPLAYVPTAKASGMSGAPKNITFLTADGFGVLPPVAKLTVESGMFHFACGFTSKNAWNRKGHY